MQGNILKKLRGDTPRADVAIKLGITPQGLGMIERGQRFPRRELMEKIANYYKTTVQEIFFDHQRHESWQEEQR